MFRTMSTDCLSIAEKNEWQRIVLKWISWEKNLLFSDNYFTFAEMYIEDAREKKIVWLPTTFTKNNLSFQFLTNASSRECDYTTWIVYETDLIAYLQDKLNGWKWWNASANHNYYSVNLCLLWCTSKFICYWTNGKNIVCEISLEWNHVNIRGNALFWFSFYLFAHCHYWLGEVRQTFKDLDREV